MIPAAATTSTRVERKQLVNNMSVHHHFAINPQVQTYKTSAHRYHANLSPVPRPAKVSPPTNLGKQFHIHLSLPHVPHPSHPIIPGHHHKSVLIASEDGGSTAIPALLEDSSLTSPDELPPSKLPAGPQRLASNTSMSPSLTSYPSTIYNNLSSSYNYKLRPRSSRPRSTRPWSQSSDAMWDTAHSRAHASASSNPPPPPYTLDDDSLDSFPTYYSDSEYEFEYDHDSNYGSGYAEFDPDMSHINITDLRAGMPMPRIPGSKGLIRSYGSEAEVWRPGISELSRASTARSWDRRSI